MCTIKIKFGLLSSVLTNSTFVCINSLAGLLGILSQFSSYVIKYLVAGAAVYGTRDVGTEGSKIHIWVIEVIGKLPDGLKRNDVALCMF